MQRCAAAKKRRHTKIRSEGGFTMLKWLSENWATIVVAAVLICALAAIAIVLIKNKKQGKSSCGCNCQSCALCGKCHGSAASNRPESKRQSAKENVSR